MTLGELSSRGDFLVGATLGREAGDLCFLGGQVVAGFDAPFPGVLAGGLELDAGAFGERFHAELREQLVPSAQSVPVAAVVCESRLRASDASSGLPNTRCARGWTRAVPAVGSEPALLAADVVPLGA
jgi:hypothetical protein